MKKEQGGAHPSGQQQEARRIGTSAEIFLVGRKSGLFELGFLCDEDDEGHEYPHFSPRENVCALVCGVYLCS